MGFDELFAESAGLPVDGVFMCQTCDEEVDEAFVKDGNLSWTCSDGHVSLIEGFM